MSQTSRHWYVYRGALPAEQALTPFEELPAPPPWRRFSGLEAYRGPHYVPSAEETRLVNTALYLRRPMLVLGDPGAGKSSLIYAIAHELGLGSVLRWSINSRSTLTEGLYQYDAIARLRDAQIPGAAQVAEDIGRYITLGPLGTALLPQASRDGQGPPRPRALLIDEIDKSDIDLPNDLLHVLEEGSFEIPELVRQSHLTPDVRVMPYDGTAEGDRVTIRSGRVRCGDFPVILMTSNQERDLPPAFMRRCIRLEIPVPNEERLRAIVERHLSELQGDASLTPEIHEFANRRGEGLLSNDQLLNLAYLLTRAKGGDWEDVRRLLLQSLDGRPYSGDPLP